MDCDTVTVTVHKWDEWNIRSRDYKKPWWFAMSNTITQDNYDLSDAEFRALVHVFCLCSKKKSLTVEIDLADAKRLGKVNPKALFSLIEKFSKKGILSQSGQILAESRSASDPTQQDKTEQNITRQAQRAKPSDFESVYRLFPKKEGKTRGLEYLAKKAPLGDANYLADLETAAVNYSEHVRKAGTDRKYIKLFSTWVTEWRDWLDPQTGKMKFTKKETPAHPPVSEQPLVPLELTAEEKAKIKKTFGDKFNDKLGEAGA